MDSPRFDNSYARLPDGFFARVEPERVPQPSLVKLNVPLARELGLDPDWLASPAGLDMLSGNATPRGAEPIAMVYAGHQFGGWSPQLGDGRALLLGEVVDAAGTRRDLQLKGSGRTPFSRQGDGKSPLGPVLREYLVSEAMAALGIPTTRALAAVTTGESVFRETTQPGGILTRVASSHVRVGTFQYFLGRQRPDLIRQLADYVIARHVPEAAEAERPYRALLEDVARRQARLIARWMQVGFVHGVMNTDNMQIAGETIDFGPCAFMESFDANTVFSSIDHHGRYAWGNQPAIGQWNLTRLAEALLSLLDDDPQRAEEQAREALAVFAETFDAHFASGFAEKLGLPAEDDLMAFLRESFAVLAAQRVDFTLFFRQLTRIAQGADDADFRALFADPEAAGPWLATWRARLGAGGAPTPTAAKAMARVNPIYLPRNHRVEEAIQKGLEGDFRPFERMNEVWTRPFTEQPGHEDLERPASDEERVHRTFCGT